MKTPPKDRIAFYLERFRVLRPLLFRYDNAVVWGGKRYVNRINGHVVIVMPDGSLR